MSMSIVPDLCPVDLPGTCMFINLNVFAVQSPCLGTHLEETCVVSLCNPPCRGTVLRFCVVCLVLFPLDIGLVCCWFMLIQFAICVAKEFVAGDHSEFS